MEKEFILERSDGRNIVLEEVQSEVQNIPQPEVFVIRYNHKLHLLSIGQIECEMHL